jgi:LacI family transcriptional regulator
MQFAEVAVTTVGPVLEEVADVTAAQIIALIEGQEPTPIDVFPPVLIPRASVSEYRLAAPKPV